MSRPDFTRNRRNPRIAKAKTKDRIEGYADGLSQNWQQRRSAAYNAANWDAWQDSARLSGATAPKPVSGWQRVINWLRACLS